MSANFSIYVEGEAPVDDFMEGPNPAEDAGELNDGNGQPVTGLNDGEEVWDEIQVSQKYHRIYLQNDSPAFVLTFSFQLLLPLQCYFPTQALPMSLNFTIFDAGKAPPEEILDGPNPAEDPGATNGTDRPPVLGYDGGDVIQVSQKYHLIYLQDLCPVIFLIYVFNFSSLFNVIYFPN